jgi:glutamate-1-semialdehyde aminotransferase
MSKNMSNTERFKHYANLRLNNTLVSLERLSYLSNTKSYQYTEKDIDKLIDILDEAVDSCKIKLRSQINNKDYFK